MASGCPSFDQDHSVIESDNNYDQVTFFPGETQDDFTGNLGVFDFDGALF